MLDTIQAAITGNNTPALDTTIDETLTLLKNARRRQVIKCVVTAPEPVTVGELAERIAAREEGVSREIVGSQARKRVYVGLYQGHLDKLDQAGFVAFDNQQVTATWRTQLANDLVDTIASAHRGGDTENGDFEVRQAAQHLKAALDGGDQQ
jgi:hypothetical protein